MKLVCEFESWISEEGPLLGSTTPRRLLRSVLSKLAFNSSWKTDGDMKNEGMLNKKVPRQNVTRVLVPTDKKQLFSYLLEFAHLFTL